MTSAFASIASKCFGRILTVKVQTVQYSVVTNSLKAFVFFVDLRLKYISMMNRSSRSPPLLGERQSINYLGTNGMKCGRSVIYIYSLYSI